MTRQLWRDDEDSKQLYLNWKRNQRYVDYLKEEIIPFNQYLYDTGSELDRERALKMSRSIKYEMDEIKKGRLNAPEDWEG